MNLFKRNEINTSLFSGSIAELLHPPVSQIPFLDGLRSIAVLLVLSAHLTGRFIDVYGPNFYSRLPFVANGAVGVDLFFVLSGFFIGSQLWKELRDRGTINVGRFVLRRGFRIWPLYFFMYLCVLTFELTLGHGAAAKEYGWSDLIFITNFHSRGLVMGSWSLCTEEQFYIVAPLALFLFARHLRLIRRCRPWLWGLLFAIPLIRTIVWIHATGHFFQHSPRVWMDSIYFTPYTHCDGLIMGMIIANLWVTREKPASRLATPIILAVAAIGLSIVLNHIQKEIFQFTISALVFGSFVWLGIQRSLSIFNSRVFYWISRLSYGMYLNHEYMCPWIVRVLLSRLPFAVQFPVLANIIGFALITLFSAAIALVTFCLVEYPFLQMRKTVLGRRQALPIPTEPKRALN
jgi:peptidoglycan/LPS O-acetylase OafA/YrhL